jgi:endoglucanase
MNPLNSITKNIQGFFRSFYFIPILIIAILVSFGIYSSIKAQVEYPKPFTPTKDITWGIIDNYGTFDSSKDITFQHVFVSWKKNDATETTQKLSKIISQGRTPVLTVEPWVNKEDVPFIYNKILEGKYDDHIIPICESIAKLKSTVYFRFAHEMDLYESSRYPWSNPGSDTYQIMFRKIVDLCKSYASNLKIVWSPGGTGQFMNYYPGDEYVDVIGFSVYSFQEYESKTADRNFNFQDLFDSKYNTVKNLKKDVMIAEMGVSGSPEYKEKWLSNALEKIKSSEYQRYLKYVIYLNAKDEFPWVEGINPPDFTIKKNKFPAN